MAHYPSTPPDATHRLAALLAIAGSLCLCAASSPPELHGETGYDNTVELAPADSGEPPHGWLNQAIPQTANDPNSVMYFGYNAARQDASRHGAWFAIESHYDTGSTELTEFHWQYAHEDSTSRRPVTATVDRNTLDTSVGLTGRIVWTAEDGTQLLTLERNGHLRLYDASGSSFFYKLGNNTPIIAGQDSSGAARELMRIGSDDKLYIDVGQNLAAIRMHAPVELMHGIKPDSPATVTTCDDLITALAALGLVVDGR